MKKTRFDKSENGKAWIAKGKNQIAINFKLDGTKWEFGDKSFEAFTQTSIKKRKREGINAHSHSCHILEETEVAAPVSTAHKLRCGIITPHKKKSVMKKAKSQIHACHLLEEETKNSLVSK